MPSIRVSFLRQYNKYQCRKQELHLWAGQTKALQQTKVPTKYLIPSGELLEANKHKNKSKCKRVHIISFMYQTLGSYTLNSTRTYSLHILRV